MSDERNGWVGHWPAGDLTMREIQNIHMDERGWSDIGYSFGIDRHGTTYEGRGLGIQGAHTAGVNSTRYGVVFMINVGEIPPVAMLDAFISLREYVYQAERHPRNPVSPHHEFSATECPGPHLTTFLASFDNPVPPKTANPLIADHQRRLNTLVNAGLVADGLYGPATAIADNDLAEALLAHRAHDAKENELLAAVQTVIRIGSQ